MKIKTLIIPSLLFFACGESAKPKDEVETMKQELAKENIPMTVPDTSLPSNWNAVEFNTNYGKIVVGLNPATPKHSENFYKLASEGYYNGVLFHRVIKQFMVQTGDPNSKNAKPDQQLGDGGPKYKLPAEISDTIFHYKGALAAARESDDRNPMKMSSGSQFYIVTGSPVSSEKFKEMLEQNIIKEFLSQRENMEFQMRLNTAYEMGNQLAADIVIKEIKPLVKDKIEAAYNNVPQKTRNIYASWGGTPFLDNNYTVFGKVISGHHIVDKIQWIGTGKNDRPVNDVKIISTKVIPKKN